MYTPYAKIWHKESATIGKSSAFKLYFDARNPFIVIMKHQSNEFIRIFFWNHLYEIFISSLVNLKRFNFNNSLSIWKGFFSAIWWGLVNKKFGFNIFFKV